MGLDAAAAAFLAAASLRMVLPRARQLNSDGAHAGFAVGVGAAAAALAALGALCWQTPYCDRRW